MISKIQDTFEGDVCDLAGPGNVAETASPVGDRAGRLSWLESILAWLCECKRLPGWRAFLFVVFESFAVPDREDVNLSAKKPSLFDVPNPSDLSINAFDGMTLRLVSCSFDMFKKRVVAGVGRGVASLDVRCLVSVPSSGEEDLLEFSSFRLSS